MGLREEVRSAWCAKFGRLMLLVVQLMKNGIIIQKIIIIFVRRGNLREREYCFNKFHMMTNNNFST